MFLYREGYYGSGEIEEEGDKNHGECIVAKNRHGETRTVDLHWQGEYMRFTAQEAYRSDF
jgi:replicative DNA helicase